MQPKSIALLQKIDTTIEQVLTKFQDMFEVALVQDKPKEQLSVENVTLEADALAIIRLCEELLLISRDLKETWCLGTLKVQPETVDVSTRDVDDVFNKFNVLTEKIAHFQSAHS